MPFTEGIVMIGHWEVLKQTRTVSVIGEITEELGEKIINQITYLLAVDSKAQITMLINSPGGDASVGLSIAQFMLTSTAPFKVIALAEVFSAATILLAVGDTRVAMEHTQFLHHSAEISTDGSSRRIKQTTAALDHSEESWNILLGKYTKRRKKFWDDLMNKGDVYLSAKDLLKYGVVDEVIYTT